MSLTSINNLLICYRFFIKSFKVSKVIQLDLVYNDLFSLLQLDALKLCILISLSLCFDFQNCLEPRFSLSSVIVSIFSEVSNRFALQEDKQWHTFHPTSADSIPTRDIDVYK